MGLSRNKVAVPEGAAGSPPFYGVFFRTPVWRPSCGPRAGDRLRSGVGVLVWKRSLASRVPFGGPGSGADMLLGSRTATRDLVARGFPDVPGGMPSALRAAGRVRSGRVVV